MIWCSSSCRPRLESLDDFTRALEDTGFTDIEVRDIFTSVAVSALHIPWVATTHMLRELWVGGELLNGPEELETGQVVLVVEASIDELPWNGPYPPGTWLADRLRLTRLPVIWHLRPNGYPAWNPLLHAVVRFWSADGGPDRQVIEQLRKRRLAEIPVVRPSDAELVAQFAVELRQCRRRLRQVLDDYWQPSWRRRVKADGGQPDDWLWRAAQAVRELEDALAHLGRAGPAASPAR